ncbi:hypothetical protein C8R46DRAFT_1342268 [Mycena filopes]|nr:hypothetical protein C8R46DRAFT_1342268 [Mycena filopes]
MPATFVTSSHQPLFLPATTSPRRDALLVALFSPISSPLALSIHNARAWSLTAVDSMSPPMRFILATHKLETWPLRHRRIDFVNDPAELRQPVSSWQKREIPTLQTRDSLPRCGLGVFFLLRGVIGIEPASSLDTGRPPPFEIGSFSSSASCTPNRPTQHPRTLSAARTDDERKLRFVAPQVSSSSRHLGEKGESAARTVYTAHTGVNNGQAHCRGKRRSESAGGAAEAAGGCGQALDWCGFAVKARR